MVGKEFNVFTDFMCSHDFCNVDLVDFFCTVNLFGATLLFQICFTNKLELYCIFSQYADIIEIKIPLTYFSLKFSS